MCLPVPYSRTKCTLYLVLNTKLLAVGLLAGLLHAVGLIVLLGDHPLGVHGGNVAVLVIRDDDE